MSAYHKDYLLWFIITVVIMLSFYGENDNEPWQRLMAFALTICMLLAVPRKPEDKKDA